MGARPSSFKIVAVAVEQKPERVWSDQQELIFQWFEKTYWPALRNCVVRARAGTGKTTTILEGVNRAPESSILLCAFNKRIADELNARLDNPNAEAKTLHALGYQMIRREWRGMPVEQSTSDCRNPRAESLTTAALKLFEDSRGKAPYQIRRMITTLHTKGREMCPLDPTEDALTSLAFQFDLVPEGWQQFDLDFVVTHALLAMAEAASTPPRYDVGIDYADMIYLPLVWNLTAKDYQLVVVDEAQDMSVAQLEIAERVCSGRICIVGDDRQAIYGFRGADSNSLNRLKAKLGALELPLTVTYRCGTKIVENAQHLVPDITAGPNNTEGVVDSCNLEQLYTQVQPGDFVLSRLNAPLVSVTLQLLRRGVRARMAGRDIGAGIVRLLQKLKITDYVSLPDAIKRIETWERKTVTKLAAHGQIDLVDKARDQAEMLIAMAQDASSTKDLFRKCDYLFTDDGDVAQVLCSSIHKAKGLETERVFVLMDTLYRRGESPEEMNCHYVAVTRPKVHLTLVRG
jgi:superfamily I DNA/RNA helicase